MSDKRFRDDDGKLDLGKIERYEDSSYKIVLLLKYIEEQQDTIITLKRRLEKINGGYGHLTHCKGLTANEWVIESQEKELKKKNEQISDLIEQHSKDVVKIGEQQTTIRELKEEMVRLHKMSIELMDRVIPILRRENEQLRQILKDIVGATDETYTKNRSIYKVSVVFNNETYLKIKEVIE